MSPKHDVVCLESTGPFEGTSKMSLRPLPDRNLRNIHNHKNPLLRSNKRSAVTHEMLSRMLHFTVCAWIFYEHYPVENQCTSVLSDLRKHRSVEVKLFIICEITPKWKLLTLGWLKALEMFVEHKISQASCIFSYYKSKWGCQAPKCHFLWRITCKTYSMKADKK